MNSACIRRLCRFAAAPPCWIGHGEPPLRGHSVPRAPARRTRQAGEEGPSTWSQLRIAEQGEMRRRPWGYGRRPVTCTHPPENSDRLHRVEPRLGDGSSYKMHESRDYRWVMASSARASGVGPIPNRARTKTANSRSSSETRSTSIAMIRNALTLKYEEVYLMAYASLAAARSSVGRSMAFYNGLVLTPRLTGARPIRPTTPRCPSAWQHNARRAVSLQADPRCP